jgi:ubiquinone/menaquinone biosynthesis C-methylase UbiE
MSDAGQLTSTAAEVYDEFFLPALFAAWAPRVVEAADLQPGMRVVDVACGTGVLALEAAKATAPGGTVVGVDLNAGMLAVARRKAPELQWEQAPAEALPFESETFDAALSQFGLMFFAEQRAAISEMWRVLRPGGRLAVAVWDALDNTPGYSAVTALLARLFGQDVASLLKTPYALGDSDALCALFEVSGVLGARVRRLHGEAKFPSIRSWMHTDVRGWTLADKLDDSQFEHLVSEAEGALGHLASADGSVRFAHDALIATARK